MSGLHLCNVHLRSRHEQFLHVALQCGKQRPKLTHLRSPSPLRLNLRRTVAIRQCANQSQPVVGCRLARQLQIHVRPGRRACGRTFARKLVWLFSHAAFHARSFSTGTHSSSVRRSAVATPACSSTWPSESRSCSNSCSNDSCIASCTRGTWRCRRAPSSSLSVAQCSRSGAIHATHAPLMNCWIVSTWCTRASGATVDVEWTRAKTDLMGFKHGDFHNLLTAAGGQPLLEVARGGGG